MWITRWKMAIALCLSTTVLVGGLALVQAQPGSSANTVTPPAELGQLSKEAARLYTVVKKPHPGELKWQQIPWLVDLNEGVQLAKQEKRPLLLFVTGDDPLEKC